MRNVYRISKMIFKSMVASPLTLLLHLVLPVASVIIMTLLLSQVQEESLYVGIVDLDKTSLSQAFSETFIDLDGIEVHDLSVYEADTYLEESLGQVVIEIPSGFQDDLMNTVGHVKLSALNEINASWIAHQSNVIIATLEAIDGDVEKVAETYKNVKSLKVYDVQDELKGKESFNSVIGVYLLLMLLSAFTISFKIVKARENGTLQRIGLAPVHPKIYVFANLVVNLIFLLIQNLLILTIMKYAMGVELYTSMFNLMVVLGSFALCGISGGVLIASVSHNLVMANGILAFVLSPTCMIAGCMWPIKYMPDLLQKMAYLMPQRWILDAVMLVQKYDTTVRAIPNLLIVFGFTAVFFLTSVYNFKQDQYTI